GQWSMHFHLSEDAGYSEYWRRSKSPVELFELARLLLGLRKVASYVGRNVGAIIWAGMEAENALVLDPGMVMGSYPVPAEKTDRVTGLVVRLALGKTEWSQRLAEPVLWKMKVHGRHAAQLGFYLDICEKVYLDCLSNRTPLGFYTEAHRLWTIARAAQGASRRPNISELLHQWWKAAADRSRDKYRREWPQRPPCTATDVSSFEECYQKPLSLLNPMVDELIHKTPLLPTVTERCDHRLNLYLSVWPDLLKCIDHWPVRSKIRDARALKRADRPADACDEEAGQEVGQVVVLPELLEKATRAVPVYTEDVKRVVRDHQNVVVIEGNDIVMPARDRLNKRILHHLSIIIRASAQRKAVVSRGLKAGKMDRRRLYRANITGTIFKSVKTDFELPNDMVVLVDSSGSMSATHLWENVEAVYQTLFTAIYSFNPQARLLAYNEIKDKCLVTEIYQKGCFYNVLRHGKTASGEAIIATALALKTSHKRPFILHITDGASNWGCGVADAISLCRGKGINLLTLGVGCGEESRRSLTREYGRLVQFIERIDALPHLLRDLLIYSRWS
ncbi:MAG: VWA domain-containing protein, partial [Deltaproteobacteria bacterium]|nr:VWA domain-containing protein [Deltaproteobacteria bacterium]